ncbi:alpha/beta hydrolase [Burkholderia anthina]|uniref:alpha/beta hydrolase n=1 Tax=Burkholderia anthina TaxID=179879 RepID=UPI001CF37DF5|nr:alpha/beta hydrolase [Burkholderia anthina]MCA8090989.1 alpha/beta hydrolase [Burkholderia anthina]
MPGSRILDTRHLVDPDIRPWLDAWPTVTLDAGNLARHRARTLPLPPIDTVGTTLQQRRVPGPGGAPDVPVRVYLPDDAARPLPAIVHMHGGGYVRGAAQDLEAVHRPLVKALGCALVSIDYRLAPETPFPGAIDDCYAALAWTFRHADALGIDAARIGVAGESAGGGLAAALALLARDRGEYPLAFQHLMYPMLDDRTCVRAPHPHAGEFVWHAANNRFGWTSLLGHAPGIDGVSPYASAARAERLDGLPPAFIAVGTLDLFADENIDYAQRLIRAGVPAELHVFPGGVHGFDIVPDARLSAAARRIGQDALRRFLHG